MWATKAAHERCEDCAEYDDIRLARLGNPPRMRVVLPYPRNGDVTRQNCVRHFHSEEEGDEKTVKFIELKRQDS